MAALNLNDVYAFSDDELFSSKPEDSQNPAAEELFKRCNALLNEILSFQRSLRRANVERSVELRIFVNQVRAEERFIQGVSASTSCICGSSINAQRAPDIALP